MCEFALGQVLRVCVCMYVCMYININVCVHVHFVGLASVVCICVIHTYIHTYTHTHTCTYTIQIAYILASEGFGFGMHPLIDGTFGLLLENWDEPKFTDLPTECSNTSNQRIVRNLAWISTDQYSTYQHVSFCSFACMYVCMYVCM